MASRGNPIPVRDETTSSPNPWVLHQLADASLAELPPPHLRVPAIGGPNVGPRANRKPKQDGSASNLRPDATFFLPERTAAGCEICPMSVFTLQLSKRADADFSAP